jgi:hypothetical protein
VNATHTSCIGTTWSPNSKPFDLVWAPSETDYNGLPVNPWWAYQFSNPNALPDFEKICGPAIVGYSPVLPAFYGGIAVDAALLAQDCTSQPTKLDIDESLFRGVDGFCSGVIDGHLTWINTVATYTGWIHWESWSGGWSVANWVDGDYTLLLTPTPVWPLAGENAPGFTHSNQSGIGLEFNDAESINNAGGPFWQQLVACANNLNNIPTNIITQIPVTLLQAGANAPPCDPSLMLGGGHGLPGVVTGVIGIDGVHDGGYTESHPVFALALDTQEAVVDNNSGLQQTWAMFLRTHGNGGGCSEAYYTWQRPNNTYYILLPWPQGATGVKPVGQGATWNWSNYNGAATTWVYAYQVPGSTLISVQFAGDGDYGMDGQFTIEYTFPPGYDANRSRKLDDRKEGKAGDRTAAADRVVSSRSENDRDVFKLASIASRIADPAARAKFSKDAEETLKPLFVRHPAKKPSMALMKFDATRKPQLRNPGTVAATGVHSFADPAKKQRDEAIKKLLNTYCPKIQPALPDQKVAAPSRQK